MPDRKISDTILIHRIAGASTGSDIDALKHDLPDDRVTRALATALANALDELNALAFEIEDLDAHVIDI